MVGGERGRNREDARAMLRQGGPEIHQDTAEEEDGQHRLEGCGKPPAPHADAAEQPYGGKGEECLPQIDIIARHLVVEPHLESRAEKVAENQGQGRGIGPGDGDEHEEQEPGAHEPVVVAENVLGKGIGSPCVGIAVHHVMVVEADD